MPSKNRKTPIGDERAGTVSFEQAVAELESIVEQMENEQLPLNELIDQYEKGVRLFSTCDRLLGQARERLELITLEARERRDVPTAKSHPPQSTGDDETDDDDIRLF